VLRRTVSLVTAGIVAGAALVSLVPTTGGFPTTSVVHADVARRGAPEDLEVASDTTFTFDPAVPAVHVHVVVSATNHLAAYTTGNIRYTPYYDGLFWPVPSDAVNVGAQTDGRALAVDFAPAAGDVATLADIHLAHRLLPERTAQLELSFDLVGAEVRSSDPTRVNAAYAGFFVYGVGTPGEVDVHVVMPRGLVADWLGGDLTHADGAWSALDITDPDHWQSFVWTRDDSALQELDQQVRTPEVNASFDVRAWPGDDEWATFVSREVAAGLPELQRIIGRAWPLPDTVDIREAYTPYLFGYAGLFDNGTNDIELGEDLDANVVIHELSHAWFNDDLFDARWLGEGFAQAYAAAVQDALGEEHRDVPHPLRTASYAFALEEWDGMGTDDTDDARRTYGYDASWYVVDQLVQEVGLERMDDVLGVALDGKITYQGDADREPSSAKLDWRHLLDLLDDVGGSTTADELFVANVLTADEAELLTARDTSRTAYDSLVEDGAGWAAPLDLREAMSSWTFVVARMAAARTVLDARDALVPILDDLGVDLPAGTEAAYEETSANADRIVQDLSDMSTAATHAVDRRDLMIAAYARLGVDPATTIRLVHDATHDDLAAMAAGFDAAAAAADRVAAARASVAADRDLLTDVGLWSVDVDGPLADAAAALRAGDLPAAIEAGRIATARVEAAHGTGLRRVMWAGEAAAACAIAIAGTGGALVRRRRRSRSAPLDAPTGSDIAPAGPVVDRVEDEVGASEGEGEGEVSGSSA